MALISGLVKGSVLVLEFHDSQSRNSFSLSAAEDLHSWSERAKREAKSILFKSHGRVFCSGGNLSDYAKMTSAEPGREVNRKITKVLADFSSLGLPTVCAVDGDCFGGGLELISAFDVVIASPHALFGFWQRKIGLSYGWGGGARIKKRIGSAKMKSLALATSSFGASEALRIGLIDQVVMRERLYEVALEKATKLSSLPTAPVEVLKNFTAATEQTSFEKLWWNEEHQTALASRQSKANGKLGR